MHQWTIQYRTNVYECLSPGLRIGSTVNSMQLCKVSLRFASTLSCMSSNCNLKWICHFAFIWNPLQMVSDQLLTTSAVHWNVKLAFDDDGTPGVMEWLSAFVRSDLDDGKVLPMHCCQPTIQKLREMVDWLDCWCLARWLLWAACCWWERVSKLKTPQLESEASVYYLQAFVFEVYNYVPVKGCFKLYDEAWLFVVITIIRSGM